MLIIPTRKRTAGETRRFNCKVQPTRRGGTKKSEFVGFNCADWLFGPMDPPGYEEIHTITIGAWRSLVARLLWEQEVPSSNLGAPTKFLSIMLASYIEL